MLDQLDVGGANSSFERARLAQVALVGSAQESASVVLERIATRRCIARDEEVYGDGNPSDYWYKVISGTVRVCKLLTDGRRHIAEFCFPGDCFGLDYTGLREYSAEAVDDVVVMRYPRRATERLIDVDQHLARHLTDMTLRGLAHAQTHMLLLGRMTAPERVACFLLEMCERQEMRRILDVPMSRIDIADYLGLTYETVCRVLSRFKRDGAIIIRHPHQIEFRDREALEALGDS